MRTTFTPHRSSILAQLTSQGKAEIALPMMATAAILPMTTRDLFDLGSIFKTNRTLGRRGHCSMPRLKHNHSKLLRFETYPFQNTPSEPPLAAITDDIAVYRS